MRKDYYLSMTIAVSAVLLGLAGCSKKNEDVSPKDEVVETMPPEVAIDESVLYDLYYEVDGLIQAGDTNKANQVFVAALDNKDFGQLKAPLFNTMIRYFLFTGQFDAARTQYLNALRVMPEIAEPGFDTIYGAYVNNGDVEGALGWAKVLATQDIGDDLRMTATDWLITSLYKNGKAEEMLQETAAAVEKFDAAKFAPVLRRMGQEAIGEGKPEVAGQIVGVITASSKKGEAPMMEAAKTLEIRIDAAKDEWAKIVGRTPQLITEVPDASLQQAMLYAFQTARAAKKYDMVNEMAAKVVLDPNASKCEKTLNVCAREWVGVIFQGEYKDIPSFPGHLAKLMEINLAPGQIYSIYSRHFYDVIGDAATLKECVVLVDKLMPLLTDEASQNALRSYQLDASFIVEDYPRALAILEKGVADHDEAWHKMAIVKVKAHKALKEKDYDGAVKYFREFMTTVGEENANDPVTDVVYSHATLMGNNEKRIGDILIEAGKKDEASKAYAAAKEWYVKALESNKEGEATEKYIKEQMKAVPGAPASPAVVKPAAASAPVAPAAK